MRSMKARSLNELKRLAKGAAPAQAATETGDSGASPNAPEPSFRASVGAVTPLRAPARAARPGASLSPTARQRQRDDAAVLRESIGNHFDIDTLLETDEGLSFRQRGVGPDVLRKLRRGHWTLQGQIDLHGLRSDAAHQALAQFIQHAHKQGWRCVRVIHGKGLGSPGKSPVLKERTPRWLAQRRDVIAFVQARACDGGAGALMVLLSPMA